MKKEMLFALTIIFYCSSWAQDFIPYLGNPVIDTLNTTNSNEFWTRWKTDPFVIHWNNDSLRMYYGTNNYGVGTQIGTAVSSNGNVWKEKRDAPVLTTGPKGSWDEYDVETPGVIHVPSNPDSMQYMLYYSGATADSILLDTVNPVFYNEEIYQLGLAYSSDGINFTKYNNPSNDSDLLYADSDPILRIPYSSGSWPDTINHLFASIAEPSPMFDATDNLFKMWFIGLGCSNPTCSGASDYRFRVLYSESTNGIDWSTPAVSLDNGSSSDFDSELVYAPHVVKVGAEYWMFYGGNNYSTGTFFLFSQKIGLATSTDGINFTKETDNPIILNGNGGMWNELGSNYPASILYHDTLRIYYSGMQDTNLFFVPNIGYSYLDSTITGITEKNIRGSLKLYPIPANDYFIIESEKSAINQVKIYDYIGRLFLSKRIQQTRKARINVSLPKGIYMVKVLDNYGDVQTQKLVIR